MVQFMRVATRGFYRLPPAGAGAPDTARTTAGAARAGPGRPAPSAAQRDPRSVRLHHAAHSGPRPRCPGRRRRPRRRAAPGVKPLAVPSGIELSGVASAGPAAPAGEHRQPTVDPAGRRPLVQPARSAAELSPEAHLLTGEERSGRRHVVGADRGPGSRGATRPGGGVPSRAPLEPHVEVPRTRRPARELAARARLARSSPDDQRPARRRPRARSPSARGHTARHPGRPSRRVSHRAGRTP
jgi:hypothetical protein